MSFLNAVILSIKRPDVVIVAFPGGKKNMRTKHDDQMGLRINVMVLGHYTLKVSGDYYNRLVVDEYE